MSISSVSAGSTAAYANNNTQKELRAAFKQVADAINKGDLKGAQNAFDNLAQLLNIGQQNNGQGTASPSNDGDGDDFTTLLNQIGTALKSGDLDQAKQALQNLQQAAQSQRHHPHHHHRVGLGEASKQSVSDTTSASTDPTSIGSINLTA